MPLSWNEIRHRATAFSKQWIGVKSEQAEKQTFWNEFFNVFGISRRAVASFKEPVRKISRALFRVRQRVGYFRAIFNPPQPVITKLHG